MKNEAPAQWKSINNPPPKSGRVILACYHHGLPMVMEGFCKVYSDNKAILKEEKYFGNGIQITHWMELPQHPDFK